MTYAMTLLCGPTPDGHYESRNTPRQEPRRTRRARPAAHAGGGFAYELKGRTALNSDKTFVKMDHASWRKVLAINLDGVFNCT